LGGHPGIAKAATRLVARRGTLILNNNMNELLKMQEEVLGDNLNSAHLIPLEKDILSILSWVPQLEGSVLGEVFEGSVGFIDILSTLILACLVEVSGSNYLISSPIRMLFRRKHGYGSTELRARFSAVLRKAWERSKSSDEFNIELFDALVYMLALEGGATPRIRKTPSPLDFARNSARHL
jgi:hypothetical protein